MRKIAYYGTMQQIERGDHGSHHAGPLHPVAGYDKEQATVQVLIFMSSILGVNTFVNDVREANSTISDLGKRFSSGELIFRSLS